MLAYLDSLDRKKQVQTQYRERLRDGIEAHGVFGTFSGLLLGHSDLRAFPGQLGWPVWLADAAEWVFDGLAVREACRFGSMLLEAVPVGADLTGVGRRLVLDIIARFSGEVLSISARSKAEERQHQAIVDTADALMDVLELDGSPECAKVRRACAEVHEVLADLGAPDLFHASAVAVFSRALEYVSPDIDSLKRDQALHWLLRNGILEADRVVVARWGRARLLKYVREAPTRRNSAQDFMRFFKNCQRAMSPFPS